MGVVEIENVTKNFGDVRAADPVRGWINGAFNNELRRYRLRAAGIDPEQTERIPTWVRVEPLGLSCADEASGEVGQARTSSEAEAVLVPLRVIPWFFTSLVCEIVLAVDGAGGTGGWADRPTDTGRGSPG